MFEEDNEIVQRGQVRNSKSLPFFVIVTVIFAGLFFVNLQSRIDQEEDPFAEQSPTPSLQAETSAEVDPHYGYKPSIVLDAPPMPKIAETFTIEDAYASVPKTWTPFLATQTKMNSEDAYYLQEMFQMTDIGVRARVMLQMSLYNSQDLMDLNAYQNEMLPVFHFFENTQPPEHLKEATTLIHDALKKQSMYFEEWSLRPASQRRAFGDGMINHYIVKESSRELIQSYNILMRIYNGESDYIKRSFFNHLCALDFI